MHVGHFIETKDSLQQTK